MIDKAILWSGMLCFQCSNKAKASQPNTQDESKQTNSLIFMVQLYEPPLPFTGTLQQAIFLSVINISKLNQSYNVP